MNVRITDSEGRSVEDYYKELSLSVSGGEIVSFFSGNPMNEDKYGEPACHAYKGRALAVIKSKSPGEIKITVSGENLREGSLISYGF